MRGLFALIGALVLVAAGGALADPGPGAASVPSITSTSTLVAPPAGGDNVASLASPPAGNVGAGASASQRVSGTVASSSSVSVSPTGQAAYVGTEPAQMTVQSSQFAVTVTVIPL